MSFRQFGGLKYASKHNVVSSNLNSANQLFVTQNVGQPNSTIDFLSDISGNTTIYGNLDISGNANINGNLDVSGNVDVSGNLTAYYMYLSSTTNYATQNNAVMPKSYIDLVASGITVVGKVSATTGTLTNIDLSNVSNPLTIDGITINVNDSVLLNAQNDPSYNGVYTLVSAGNLQRSTAILPTGADAVGALVIVLNGNLYAKSGWLQTYKDPITEEAIVGMDPLDFTEFYSFNFKTGNGLISTVVNDTTYISVDPNLEYMYSIDGSSNILSLGSSQTLTTGLNFGSSTNQIPVSFNGAVSPLPIQIDASYSSVQIIFTWQPPNANSISGSLQQVNAVLYADISGNINAYPILTNNTSNVSTFNKLIISKTPTTNNGFLGGSTTTYTYYSPDFANLTSDASSNILLLWYSNFGPYPNVSNVSYLGFSGAEPPSSDATFTYYSTLTTSTSTPNSQLTLTYNPPSALVISGSATGVTLSYFTTDLSFNSTTGNTIRYPGPPLSYTIPDISFNYTANYNQQSNSQNVTFGNGNGTTTTNPLTLFPDCSYNFLNLTSTNSSLATSTPPSGPFGPYYTAPLQILNTPYPGTSYDPSNNSHTISYYNDSIIVTTPISNIYKVSDTQATTSLSNVYNNQDISSNPLGPFSINRNQNSRGNLGANKNLMNIYISVPNSNLSQTDISCNGFPTTSNPQISATNITLSSSINATDQYSGITGFTGYYLYIPAFTATIPSSLDASSNQYTFTINQVYLDISGSTISTFDASQNFYYDKYTSNPSYQGLSGFTINNNNNYYSAQVSGIWVLNQDPHFTVSNLLLNNMGDYFYKTPLVTYNINGGASGSVSETNLTHVTGLFPNINITNTNITPTTISSTYQTSINLDISYNNIHSSGQTASIYTLNVIVDVSSNLLANSITTLNDLSGSASLGYRVWSAPTDYQENMNPTGIVPFVFINNGFSIPNNTATGNTTYTGTGEGYVDISYNNIWDISNNNLTNQELLIAAGNFTTNPAYYINYSDASGNGNLNTGIDYSNLSGTRFSTFAWNVSNITSGTYNTLNFQINFTNQLWKNTQASNFAFFDSGFTQQLLLFYRFEYNNYVTQAYWGANGASYYPNTTWISINSSNSNPTTINAVTICNYLNVNNVYWTTTTISNTNNNYNYTFSTGLPTISLNNSLNNATLYLRIGIPDNLTTNSFNNVYAYLSFIQ